MDHMGGMAGTGYGYSIDTLLGGFLMLLIKLLLAVLIIAVVVGIVMWIKNIFLKDSTGGTQFFQSIKNDPVLKTISIITIAVLGIILLFALLGSFGGVGVRYGMESHVGRYGGFSPVFSVAGLLSLLIRVLTFILVISLILALLGYLKKQYDAGTFNFMKTGGPNQGNTANQGGNTNTNENNANTQ
ncbi:MAG: hypothetical protein N3I35_17205 [Clostridia bacterium]|nr:hypothetical protein [Clostridia bacterium]